MTAPLVSPRPKTPLLDTVDEPADLRRLAPSSSASSPTSCARR